MLLEKPFSQACENNKRPILSVLENWFSDIKSVLEVGSGTGQHGVFFAEQMPWLTWQASDLVMNHSGINAWIDEAQLPNIQRPLNLDVNDTPWPDLSVESVFTANTFHIMSWPEVALFFQRLSAFSSLSQLAIYGPFNYEGRFTSESNAAFDLHLKAAAPHRGIRDFEAVCSLAESIGMKFNDDVAMPANNRLLRFIAG